MSNSQTEQAGPAPGPQERRRITTYQWTSEGMVPDDWTKPAGNVSADYVRHDDVEQLEADVSTLRAKNAELEHEINGPEAEDFVSLTQQLREAWSQFQLADSRLSTLRAQLEDEKARTKAATIEADLAFESEQKFKRRVIEAEVDLTALRAQQAELVKRWDEQAEKHRVSSDRYYEVGEQERSVKMDARAQVYLSCSAELTALRARLAVPPPQKEEDDQARAAPSVPCVETTGSIAEQPTGAVTVAERTEKNKRYCPMCDEWMRSTVCRACGMATEIERKS